MHLSISNKSHMSQDIDLPLSKDKSDNNKEIFPPSRDYTTLVRSLQIRGSNQTTTSNIINPNIPLECSSVHPLTQVDTTSESINHFPSHVTSPDPYLKCLNFITNQLLPPDLAFWHTMQDNQYNSYNFGGNHRLKSL